MPVWQHTLGKDHLRRRAESLIEAARYRSAHHDGKAAGSAIREAREGQRRDILATLRRTPALCFLSGSFKN